MTATILWWWAGIEAGRFSLVLVTNWFDSGLKFGQNLLKTANIQNGEEENDKQYNIQGLWAYAKIIVQSFELVNQKYYSPILTCLTTEHFKYPPGEQKEILSHFAHIYQGEAVAMDTSPGSLWVIYLADIRNWHFSCGPVWGPN